MVRAGLFCFVAGSLLPAGLATAQDPYAGKLQSYQSESPDGRVQVLRLGYSGLLAAKPGDAVFVGDTIKTGGGIRARIELSDGTIITLAPGSNLQIKGYHLDRVQGSRNSVMKVLKGTVRFVVAKLFRPNGSTTEKKYRDSQVTIETMNAVAGVRGTDLFAVTAPDQAEFAVLDGAVHVRSSSVAQRSEVMLGADQFSIVRKGGGPSSPDHLTDQRKNELVALTTLSAPVTLSGAAPGKPKPYGAKDMARDLAAGIPLGEILDRAVMSGMTIEEAVAAVLDSGASPSAVVYTAVTEGYPANEVVTSAIMSGAPLALVMSSALAGGADKQLVIAGAVDAGVPPTAVASTLSAVLANGGGIIGAEPFLLPPAASSPSAVPLIGGGGGATPSTLPASPYKP